MTAKEISFLNESNRIEGIDKIDYSIKSFRDPKKGHYGAFVCSQEMANSKIALNAKTLRKWQALLGEEQQKYSSTEIGSEQIGHFRSPQLPVNVRVGKHIPPDYRLVGLHMMELIRDINEKLKRNLELYKKNNKAFVEFAGESFLTFEKIHPFADGNGRTGRLLVNYLATYCERPLIHFPSEMSVMNRYFEAHESPEKMSNFIADRIYRDSIHKIEESKKESVPKIERPKKKHKLRK